MKREIKQWAALCAAVGIVGSAVMGCGSSVSEPDVEDGQTSREVADRAGTGSGGGAHIGIISTETGLGGNSFNDLALESVKKAATDYGITYDKVEPKSVSGGEIIQGEVAASGNYGLIICVGTEQVDTLTNVASTYPEQRFALLDATSDLPGVVSYSCRKQEGALLAGALAALAEQEKIDGKLEDRETVGFIGGVDNPLINHFATGYKAGAEYIEPEMKVLVDYAGSFNDPTTAKTIANTSMERGANVIFCAAGASGMDMFQAAEEKGFAATGVNLDQNSITLGYIMASMFGGLDPYAYHAIASTVEGTYTGENQMLGLNDGDVDVMVGGSNIRVSDDTLTGLDRLRQKIISEEIRAPSELN